MSNNAKSRKPLIVGIIAAAVILIVLLVLMLTQCTGMFGGGNTNPNQESTGDTTPAEVASYDLYWNLDRALYDGMSEAGMSSRQPAEDGYFHVRFFKDGEIVELKVADRKTVNSLEVRDLMGLEFDENGIVTGIIDIEDMPLEKAAWQFYVQSSGGKIIKANSSKSLNGMEVMLETGDKTIGVWDMTGKSGDPGCEAEPFYLDRIYAIQNEDGDLTHVFIYDRSEYMSTHEADCEHCGKVVTWYEWVKTDSLPITAGHYQLQNDITVTGQMSMAEDAKICLDLNGKRVDGAANKRIYSLHNVGAELAMMDTSEGKTGKLVPHGTGDQGMAVWLRYGVFYLYDGILDGSDAATIKSGTTVSVSAKTFFYMYGGEIIGGTSKYVKNETTGKYSQGLGGAMYVGGKFVMEDGIIRDGYAQAVTYYKDGNKVWERGIGGNIFVANNAVVEMNGGVVKNGKAGNMGGNIYMDGASEFTMNGGKIQGGTISGKGKNGGSVYVTTKAKFTQNGGSITGGTSRNCGGNVYLNGTYIMNGGVISGGKIRNYETGALNPTANSRNVFNVNGKFYMYGGRIYGGFQAIDSKTGDKVKPHVLLSGYATIKGTVEGGKDMVLTPQCDGVKVTVGNMLSGSSVGVHATTGIFSEKTKQANVDNFYSNIEGAEVVYYDGRLALGKLACLCGANEGEEHIGECDETEIMWGPWTDTSKLPTTTGNYYLLNDVTTSQNNIAADAQIVLDLNGKTVTGKENARIYSLHNRTEIVTKDKETGEEKKTYEYNSTLTITDSSEGHVGVMAAHGSYDTQGAIVWLRYGDLNLYRGTLDASDFVGSHGWGTGSDGIYGTSDDADVNKNGVAINIPSGRTFTMYGGTVIGGSTIKRDFTKQVQTENPDGTVTETTATYTNKTQAGAGSIEVDGTFIMYGGTVRDGMARQGGNIFVARANGKFYMYGGEVLNGRTTDIGGNVYANGWVYMSGGKISGGYYQKTDADEKNENAFHANMTFITGKMEMTGGEIDGRVQFNNYNSTNGCVVRFSGSPVLHGADIGAPGLSLVSLDDKADDGITATPPLMELGELTDDALVYLNTNTTGFVSTETVEANADNFVSNYEDMDVVYYDSRLFVGKLGCICGSDTDEHINGCDGTVYAWEAWESTTGLPTTTGNYILTGNVTTKGQTVVKEGQDVKLDLNGKNVTYEVPKTHDDGFRLYRAENGGKLAITDTSTGTPGTLTTVIDPANSNYEDKQTAGNSGMLLWARGGEITIHNGILDGSALSGSKNGLIISVGNNSGYTGKVTMYNGTIKGGVTTVDGNIYVSGSGAQFILEGGTVTGGQAKRGGNIYINSSASVTINGGTVEKGSTKAGGNHGGNILVASGTTLYINGGEIKDGQTGNLGGNVKADGSIVMTGGTIKGGMNKNGVSNANANVDLVNGSLDISGGHIYGSVEVNSYNSVKGASITVSGSAKITGGTSGVNLVAGDDKADDNITATRCDITVEGTLSDDAQIDIHQNIYGYITGTTVEANVDNFASDNADYTVGYHDGKVFIGKVGCLCGSTTDEHALGCDGTQYAWTPWTATGSLPTNAGYWFLTGTVTCGQQNIAANQAVVLDLNGQTVNGTGNRVYSIHNTGASLVITDTTEAKAGTLIAKEQTSTNQGGCVWVRYGSFKLIAGTLDASKCTVKAADNGGRHGAAVSMGGNTTFDMYGGTIKGGTSVASDNGSYFGHGGAVYVVGSFTMHGGTISGGTAVNGGGVYVSGGSTFTMKNGTISGGKANYGGNVHLADGAEMVMEDGTITGGETNKSGCHGGNIYIADGAALTIKDGLVEKGKAHNLGGNIYTNGTINMEGGEVKDGTNSSGNATTNSNLAMVNAELNISGGQIYGHAESNSYNSVKGSVVTVSGSAKITGGTTGLYFHPLDDKADDGITATAAPIVVTGTLNDDALIAVHASCAGYLTEATVEANVDNFTSDTGVTPAFVDSCVFLGQKSCLCGSNSANAADHEPGCDGTQYVWAPWTSGTTLPTTTGYYYLTENVTCDHQTLAQNAAVVIDLNGKTVDGSNNQRIISTFNTGSSLVITDTVGGGSLKSHGTTGDQGSTVWVRYGSFKLIKGTLNASDFTSTTKISNNGTTNEKAAEKGGTAVAVEGGASFTMYGGEIIGGKQGESVESTNGVVYNAGPAGSLAVNGNATFTMEGGTISGGSTPNHGGNVYIGGTAYLNGGTISGGTAANGGNISINHANAKVYMNGVTVTGGTATNKGGNIYAFYAGAKLIEIKGDTLITKGTAAVDGGNIYLTADDGKGTVTVDMLGGEISEGTSEGGAGGNVWLQRLSTFNLKGGTVKNGTGDSGGNFALNQATTALNISGGEIEDGTAVNTGGNIWQNSTANTVTMSGGTISGGRNGSAGASKNGGSVFVSTNAIFNLEDGTITGGVATNGGGNVYVNGTLNMSGGEITGGGRADGSVTDALNVFVVNGKLVLSGGQIDGHASVVNSTANNTGVFELSGDPVVKNADGTNGVKIQKLEKATEWPVIKITGTVDADILVNFPSNGSAVANNVAKFAVTGTGVDLTDALKDNFTSQQGYQIARYADGLYFVPADAHIHCECGGTIESGTVLYTDADGKDVIHTCVDVLWTKASTITGMQTVSTSSYSFSKDTYFYLDEDITLGRQLRTNGHAAGVCLNGKTLTGGDNVRMLGAYLSSASADTTAGSWAITTCDTNYVEGDTTKNVIKPVGSANTQNGAGVWLGDYSSGIFYAGTIDASDCVAINGSHGLGVYVGTGSTFVQCDKTTIIGGWGSNEGTSNAHGGSVCVNGTKDITHYYMLGGTIKDGMAAQWGGNLYLYKGQFHMYDGLITNGSIMTAKNGTKDYYSKLSNVAMREDAVLEITGGTIHGSIGNCQGGKLGTIKISGTGRIARNDTSVRGNNIWINSCNVEVGNLTGTGGVGFISTGEYTGEIVLATYTGTEEPDLSRIGIYMHAHKDDTTRTFGVKLVDGQLIAYETTPTT